MTPDIVHINIDNILKYPEPDHQPDGYRRYDLAMGKKMELYQTVFNHAF